MTRKVAVVGAGISGLACALRLNALDPDLEVVVYDQADRAGGKIWTEHAEGFTIEAGPDAFLGSKRGGVSLSHALSLDERQISPIAENRRSYVLRNNRLSPLPQGLSGLVPTELRPMLRGSLLSPLGKARLAMELAMPPNRGAGDESLARFISRRLGAETYERMIEPLLSGIYSGDGAKLSLAATFPQLRASELTHGGLVRGAIAQKKETAARGPGDAPRAGFLSFDHGMSVLVDRAVESARSNGTQFEFGATCKGIERDALDNRLCVTLARGDHGFSEHVDGVVVAVPGWAAATILRDLASTASDALAEIEHVSNALIAIGFPESQLNRPLDGYGYVVPRIENRDVMAMTWTTSKWPERAPDGQVLIRAFVGRAGQTAALNGDDQFLVRLALKELREVLNLDVTPSLARVYRWDRGMPQYTMGHLDRVDRIESSLAGTPGIEIAGNMLHGVGIPDCIDSGEVAASNLLVDLNNAACQR
ncbi:MAG: protoporphyrinogen oxidase [Thermomicrobiales bacterium]